MKIIDDKDIVHPASGAVIMAIGIFLYAAVDAFTWINYTSGEVMAVFLIVLAVFTYQSIFKQWVLKPCFTVLIRNPVQSFAVGSWVAGLSVLSNVITKYFPAMSMGVQVMMMINTLLWVVFTANCFYQFKELMKRPSAYAPHGVVLLSAVATQSLVIYWLKVFSLPKGLLIGVISLGVLLYTIGLTIVVLRYIRGNPWTIIDDWPSTNCIIHGALSITGLALVTSEMFSGRIMMIFWLFVFILLICIEVMEVVRAVKRIQKLGWKRGIFTYHISQWSRNFTFGMFYAFTMTMHQNPYYMNDFYEFHQGFLHFWMWIVFLLLITEIGLWAGSNRNLHGKKTKQLSRGTDLE
ncbi:hypothetical protein JI667_11850 [Bacillus sp. NTK074B]|uniref:hypothetical protein n=1 Tax=Bacillus sp. NTK074B TaxID=2802174 RepID=UPI001A8F83CB|nr:hypothetical protein [Bacillus sp. NTK074B]